LLSPREEGSGDQILSEERRSVRRGFVVLSVAAVVSAFGATACGSGMQESVQKQAEEEIEKGRQQVEEQVQEGRTQIEQEVQEGRTQVEEQVEEGRQQVEGKQ
jgi:hypothetical protein